MIDDIELYLRHGADIVCTYGMTDSSTEGWDVFTVVGVVTIGAVRRLWKGELAVAAAALVLDLVTGLRWTARRRRAGAGWRN